MNKRIVGILIVSALLASAFPAFSGAVEQDRAGPGRQDPIDAHNITLLIPSPPVEGVFPNGNYPVMVNFTLNQEIVGLNLTFNVTGPDPLQANRTEFGNRSADDYNTSAQGLNVTPVFDFTTPGLYTVEATLQGWSNATGGNVTDSTKVADINFTTVAYYDIDIEPHGFEADGKFSKTPITVECDLNYTGNERVESTNVTMTIWNETDDTLEEVIPNFQVHQQPLEPPQMEFSVSFGWTPSVEGPYSNYSIRVNATALDARGQEIGDGNSTILEHVQVTNFTDFHIKEVSSTDTVEQGQEFPVTVTVNNTGNADGNANVKLTVFPEGDPGDIVWEDNKTSDLVWATIQDEERREAGLNVEVGFMVKISERGNYTLKGSIVGAPGVSNTSAVEVIPFGERPPEILGFSLDPADSFEEEDEITFNLRYRDLDGDAGDVTLNITSYLGGEEYSMSNVSDTFKTGANYTYTWKAEKGGTYYYYFKAESGVDSTKTAKETFEVLNHTYGTVTGSVKDEDGEGVANVSMVLYNTVKNETNQTVPDEYFNFTTDEGGNFSKALGKGVRYFLKVEDAWIDQNEYEYALPLIYIVDALTNDTPVHRLEEDFILYKKDVGPKAVLNGTVNDTKGEPLANVTVIVEIFQDDKSTVEVEVDVGGGVTENATVNVTTRTWSNLTTETDENGNFSFADVPITADDLEKHFARYPGKDTATYREDLVDVPDEREFDPQENTCMWWVNANISGYVFEKAFVTTHQKDLTEFGDEGQTAVLFEKGKTSEANFVLKEWESPTDPDIEEYWVTGTVTPADATFKIDGNAIDLNEGGVFNVTLEAKDGYKWVAEAENYISQNSTFDLRADKNLVPITLQLKGSPLVIGPILDSKDRAIVDYNVSFEYEGKVYWAETDGNGEASFAEYTILELPFTMEDMPEGIKVTLSKGDDTKEVETPLTQDDLTIEGAGAETDGTDVLLIIAIIVIVIIIIVLVVLAMKSKGIPEEELFGEEIREYECPSCGAIVTSDMTECPECGELFEEEEFRCPECGELVEKDSVICDMCGAEFEMPEKVEEEEIEEEELEEEEPAPEVIEDFEVEPEEVPEDVDLEEELLEEGEEEVLDEELEAPPEALPEPEDELEDVEDL